MSDAADAGLTLPQRQTNGMRALVEATDWSATPLGPIEAWSPALRLALDIVLASGFPMALRWGPDFVLIYNDGYAPILGDKHPWALGQPARVAWSEIWHEIEPVHRAILDGTSAAVFAEDLPMRIRRHHGMWEDARFTLSYSPTPDPTAPSGIGGVFVTAIETTDRIAAEDRLRAVEGKLRRRAENLEHEVEARTRELDRVWSNSRDLLVVIGADGVFRAVSPAWTGLLGHAEHEVVGHSFHEFIHPDDARLTQGGLDSAVAGRNLTNFENRNLHKDGSTRWISWHTSVDGDLVYAYGRDVTARKQAEAELARAQEALRQSQKMDAIGQLTGGIAHDFNNMLAVVIGSLDIARRRLQRGERGVERFLDHAQEGATRAASLTQRLLAFSRQSPLSPRLLDLNELVANISELLRRTLGERIALDVVQGGGLWLTRVDPNELETAVLNLAVNARDAMPDGGRLTIETANTCLDDRDAAHVVGLAAGQYVLLAVTDVGTGMPPDVVQRAFDPYFTTKPIGKGTGLGLSMVYGFARQSGGHVRIDSDPGRGTTVRVYLPRHFGVAEAAGGPPQAVAPPAPGSRSESVLVVEDDDRVRQMSSEAIRDLGYTVHEAASGEMALAMFSALGHVDVLVADVVMGGMTGPELADALRQHAPALRVLYTTGYSRNATLHDAAPDRRVAFLRKPFKMEDLAIKLRAVLDG